MNEPRITITMPLPFVYAPAWTPIGGDFIDPDDGQIHWSALSRISPGLLKRHNVEVEEVRLGWGDDCETFVLCMDDEDFCESLESGVRVSGERLERLRGIVEEDAPRVIGRALAAAEEAFMEGQLAASPEVAAC